MCYTLVQNHIDTYIFYTAYILDNYLHKVRGLVDHLSLNLFTVLSSSDKEKVHLSNILWRWEINFEYCRRIATLYSIFITQDVIRTIPGRFDHKITES